MATGTALAIAPVGSSAGRLLLMPNTLDLGSPGVNIRDVLPDGVLAQASQLRHWVVEDARSARAFLKRVAAHKALVLPLQDLAILELPRARKGSGDAVPAATWHALLAPAAAGDDIGLLSEAGLPAVADPGSALVAAAHAAGLQVVPLAGASSLLLALAASGMNGQSFAFVGYLPQEPAARLTRLREIEQLSKRLQQTQLVIETPYRNEALLAAMLAGLSGQTRLSISCGLTLKTGWTRSMPVAQWRQVHIALPSDTPAVFVMLAG